MWYCDQLVNFKCSPRYSPSMSNNSSSIIVADAVSIPLAGVSTIACIIALGVLLYYKMWRSFIYRLVLYLLISLLVSSLSTVGIAFFNLCLDGREVLHEVNLRNETTSGYVAGVSLLVFINCGQVIAVLLVTCITVCIHLMALHNYQFTYKSDLLLFILSFLSLVITVVVSILVYVYLAKGDYNEDYGIVVLACLLSLAIFVNVVFIALTLVPLCCRACGYNLCMRTAATIESHRKALREILPFYSLVVPFFFFCLVVSGIFFRH